MRSVSIPASAITDEKSLHREFATAMGFPVFYGGNWDAWIDCMSSLTSPEAGMTAFHLSCDEQLRIDVVGGTSLQTRCPEVVATLVACAQAVNERFETHGETARITLRLLDGAA
jgi:RNAse (barnase) inhibitor barstar